MHRETRVLEGEVVAQLAHYEGEHSRLMRPRLEVVAIHEDILPSRMSVQVATQSNLSFSIEAPYQLLDGRVHGMQDL